MFDGRFDGLGRIDRLGTSGILTTDHDFDALAGCDIRYTIALYRNLTATRSVLVNSSWTVEVLMLDGRSIVQC